MRKDSTAWFVAVFAVLLCSIAGTVIYYLQLEFPEVGPQRSIGSNLGFFLLINLNIVVMMILVFLVAKNIITLIFDRRRNILGSRLRTRLVTAFVALSLVPTVLLFLVAKGILETVLQGWFSPQVTASVDGALEVAKFHYDQAETQLKRESQFIAEELSKILSLSSRQFSLTEDPQGGAISTLLRSFLEHKRAEYELSEIRLLKSNGASYLKIEEPVGERQTIDIPELNSGSVFRAAQGESTIRPEQSLSGEYLRAYLPLSESPLSSYIGLPKPVTDESNLKNSSDLLLVVTRQVDSRLSELASTVINNYEDYKELRTYRRPLASSYLLALIVVTMLIVFAAVWIGFYLAKSLTVPIGLLAKATAQVAHGNLDYQIPDVGDDELSVLVRSFNTMTGDLKHTTDELVSRRRYMETVFANLAVGVISIDTDYRVAACNLAAAEILGLSSRAAVLNESIDEVLPKELAIRVREMSIEAASGSGSAADTLEVMVKSQTKNLQLTLTPLSDEQQKKIGAVLLLDDVTELVSAQRLAAWREVARRIAHEIKNPLTPIQLSAQRIQRRFASSSEEVSIQDQNDRALIAESTDIIVSQVESLRTLVNEFSRFARMPKSNPRPADLNVVVQDAVAVFREANSKIVFELILDKQLPQLEIDPEQMSRVLVNLIDNAISSINLALSEPKATILAESKVIIRSRYDEPLGLAILEVVDFGTGVSEADKGKLFEPYFSTKKGGTGLGLAIVSAIVSDHRGFIRVRSNIPRGAVFTIELPVTRKGSRHQAVA